MNTTCCKYCSKESKMSELIARNYKLLNVLSRFGIALGFGEKSVKEVCRINNVDCNTFLAVANLLNQEQGPQSQQTIGEAKLPDFSATALAEYLKRSHSYFLDFKLPSIREALEKAINGGSKDIKFLILKYFDEYANEVKKHMEYENDNVFPYLNRLLGTWEQEEVTIKKGLDANYSIHIFSEQHNGIEIRLSELKDIIIKYYPTHSTNELNSVLFDIFVCAQDLESHHIVEDKLFVPAIEKLEAEYEHAKTEENPDTDTTLSPSTLSDREREILIYIVHGMTNKEIAAKLFLSTHTVNTHRRNIISKLQIHSPAGLTIYAIVNKLVELEDIQI
ncbi:MAG: helix-turn-helix transcriptional regulator [Bacteroidales bacterium]